MDKHEAKLILSSYTLENEPANDARFNQAAKLAESDTELSEWWEEHKQGDALLRGKLAETTVPHDLRAALNESLHGQRQRRATFRQLRNYFAIAASFVLAGYVYFQYGIDRSDDYSGPLAQRAYDYSSDGPRLSYFNKDTQKIRNWLGESGIELPNNLPPKLLELEGIGCRPLNWSEERVAIMCFNADTVYHLFVGHQDEFESFDASKEIGYDQYSNGWAISKWKNDDYVFVLTAKTSTSNMASFLASYTP